ncbi:MAG TPA: hypothetical protein VGG57_08515 [Stellaceae bacterium]
MRRLDLAGVPLERIDSTGFMIGDTGTIYGRRTAGWRKTRTRRCGSKVRFTRSNTEDRAVQPRSTVRAAIAERWKDEGLRGNSRRALTLLAL